MSGSGGGWEGTERRRQRGPMQPTAEQTTPVDGKIGGHISRLQIDRGFGFIVVAEADPQTGKMQKTDYFFHNTELENREIGELDLGMPVRFRAQRTPKGPRATSIEVLDGD